MEIVNWQSSLSNQGLQASTCNRIFAVVRSIFNCAVRWGFLDILSNPCRDITPIPENTPHTRYLTKREVRLVIKTLQNMYNNKCALALQLLLYTGARRNEILTARWEHVHLEERILTIPISKSGKAWHIPLSDKALKIIQELKTKQNSPWLFPATNPDEHIKSVFYTWKQVRQKLGLHDVRIHDLRHSFASLLVNEGCSLCEVQKILGHYDPKVTMRYAHLAPSSLIDAANIVGKSIGDGDLAR